MGLRAWPGCVAGDCVHLAGGLLSGPWDLIFGSPRYLSGSWELECRGLGWLSLTCGHGLLGVLDTAAGLCNDGLLTSTGNPIGLSRLRETIIQANNGGAIL